MYIILLITEMVIQIFYFSPPISYSFQIVLALTRGSYHGDGQQGNPGMTLTPVAWDLQLSSSRIILLLPSSRLDPLVKDNVLCASHVTRGGSDIQSPDLSAMGSVCACLHMSEDT